MLLLGHRFALNRSTPVASPEASKEQLWSYCFLSNSCRMSGTARNAPIPRVIQFLWEKRGKHEHSVSGKPGTFPLPEKDTLREREDEARKIRRLQLMISMVMSVIGQDPNLTIEEAAELAAGAKRAALAMFPDKELAYDLLYKPRLQRLIRERFRLQ
jgi:hypothetical protein